MLSNISFQIPIGITFFALILWKFVEHKKDKTKKKINKKVLISLIISICAVVVLSIFLYQYQPIRPLERKNGISYLTNYTYNSFIVFDRNIKYVDSSCLASFISVFPIGLIIGIWYIFKEETEHLDFIFPTVIISVLDLIFLVSNISFKFLPNYIFVLGFHLLQIYMIIYIFARVEKRFFDLKRAAYVALITLFILMFMPVPKKIGYVALNLSYIIFVLEAYIVLNYSDKRFWRLASWVFTIICVFEFVGYGIVNFV